SLQDPNKNVVEDLIELQVEDPHVQDLTVVDLPAIARNPLHPPHLHISLSYIQDTDKSTIRELTAWRSVTLGRLVLILNKLQQLCGVEIYRGYCDLGDYRLREEFGVWIVENKAKSEVQMVDFRQVDKHNHSISTCTCPFFRVNKKGGDCSHIMAAKRNAELPIIQPKPNMEKLREASKLEKNIKKSGTKTPKVLDKETPTNSTKIVQTKLVKKPTKVAQCRTLLANIPNISDDDF
ncbi:unnamed protein product, partial [Didymodactylos carnosus]